MAQHRREGDVGIRGMDDHRADLAVLVPDVGPGLAAVGRLVDPVAGDDVAADVGLAGADVNHIGVDGATAIEPIEDTGCSSKTDFHDTPPSVDFQTPPEAVAA